MVTRGGSRISGKGAHMYKGVGVRFADFISFCLNDLVSLRPNYFIFIRYLKTGGREGGLSEPLNPSGSATGEKLFLFLMYGVGSH